MSDTQRTDQDITTEIQTLFGTITKCFVLSPDCIQSDIPVAYKTWWIDLDPSLPPTRSYTSKKPSTLSKTPIRRLVSTYRRLAQNPSAVAPTIDALEAFENKVFYLN